jgi:hypothetical protein
MSTHLVVLLGPFWGPKHFFFGSPQSKEPDFIVGSGSHTNLILAEVFKCLNLSTTLHLHPYTIGWLHQGRDLCVSQQWHLPYDIKPFKDEVLFDMAPLEFCDFILGQPYFWKNHVVYASIPYSVIINLGRQLYRIPEVVPHTSISLISTKKCSKFISQTRKFVLITTY